MREGIHPAYYQAKVVCNCGNEFVTGSTKEEIHVEICSKCHPFYTGQQKATQARGRIDNSHNTVRWQHEVEVVKDLNFFICADNEPKSMPAYDFGSCCDNNKKLTKRVSYCFMLTTNW